MTTITNLTCEYRTNPLGIDVTAPRLSWQLQTDRQGARQTAYRILASSMLDSLREGQADLWDSGKVESDQSIHVVYAGKKLTSRQRVYWSVTVWDETGASSSGETAWFEIGLLRRTDWKAKWIGGALVGGPRSTIPAPYLRKQFIVEDTVSSARLYVTALGLYEVTLNGSPVTEDVLMPGWTEYQKRLRYQVYDVSSLVKRGENALGALLGDGWAVGHVSWNHRQHDADRPLLLAQLELTLADGTKQIIVSDRTWKHHVGALLESDLLMGEAYDARLEFSGWDKPGFNDSGWYRAEVLEPAGVNLVATNAPPMRRIEELAPVADPVDKSGFTNKRYVYDLGQNMVGRIRFKGTAPRGTTVTFKFAEVLDPNGSGNIYTTNLRTARATDYYTFKGDGEEVWEPAFTFHGFRYVEVSGYPGKPTRDLITGIVIHSEMTPTGEFESSDPMLNQLQHNIIWGQKGNFLDVPTDCPQRDERLGWTGDIQVFSRTAAYNFNVASFMSKWAEDLKDSQDERGAVPAVVPNAIGDLKDGGPAWADAAIICPYTMYLSYGDTRILQENYAVMTRFMDFLLRESPGYIRCAPDYEGWPGFSDWLSINAITPRDLIGTAFLAYDAKLMTEIATILGKPRDAAKYRKLFNAVKRAFGKRYLKGSKALPDTIIPSQRRLQMDQADAISQGNLKRVDYGKVESKVFNTKLFNPTQTSYVLALHFDLLPEKLRPIAADELVADIQRRNMHLSTGFVGAPYLPHALSANGKIDTSYELLNQKTWPSWLYSVTQGATTIWERWDGFTEDNGLQSPEMNSFNHYAYGSIGAWMYNTVAGIEIDPSQPGYKHSIFRPQPGGGLTHAAGKLKTPYGQLVSDWSLNGGKFNWSVTVPPNTTATLHLPAGSEKITLNGQATSDSVHEVGAGTYHFVAR